MWWKKTSFLIFLTVFLACAWFFSTGGWNQISRIDAIMSFVEFPVEKRANPDFFSFRINHFVPSPEKGYNTGDWSFYKGNYYSNKAPGPLFLGILAYAPLHCLEYLIFGFLDDILTDVINMYIVNLVQSVLPAALAAWILFHILQMLGTGKYASAFWSLAYGLGTPVFCYSSMMWGHVLAACCFMFAIYFYLKNKNKSTVWCGLFCGFAVLSDYLCAALVPAFAAMLFLREYLKTEGRGKEKIMEGIKSLVHFALGGLPMFLLYALYHKICFGSFFTPATVFNNPMFHDKDTLGGTFGSFRPFIILKLLISQHRGLLFYSPVLLAFVPGFLNMIRKEREKKILAWGLLAVIFMTLFSLSSFNGWHGGHSFSARYLIPVIPAFAVLCGAFPLNTLLRKIFAAGAFLLSFFYMLTANYLNPLVNDFFLGYLMDLFRNTGKMPPPPHLMRMYGMIENMKEEAAAYSSFSLGELFGFSGYGSLILLTLILCVLFYGIFSSSFSLLQKDFAGLSKKQYKISFDMVILSSILLLTLLFPGNEVWINDEPHFILKALQCNDKLQFASSAFPGSFGIAYGPGAVWFFQILLLFTFHPVVIVFLKTSVTLLLILWAFRKIFRFPDHNWLIPASLFLVSPYVLHFNRKIWDCGVLYVLAICMFAFVSDYIRKRELTALTAASLCALFMLLTHPLSLPVAVLLPVFVFICGFMKEENRIPADRKYPAEKTFLHTIYSACITGIPSLLYYLCTVKRIPGGSGEKGGNGSVFQRLFEYCGNLSGYKVVDEFILDLLPQNTILYQYCSIVSVIIAVFFLCGMFLGVWYLVKNLRKNGLTEENIFILFAAMLLVTKFLFDFVFRLALHPHYHMLAVVPLLILFTAGIKQLPEWRNPVLYGMIFAVLTVSVIFVFTVDFSCGSRSFAYGPTLGNQYENIRIVNRMKSLGVLNNFRHSVGNYRAFPQALECLFLLHDHSYKPEEKFLPPSGVKYDVILRYISPAPVSGLLGVDVRQVSGPEYDFFANRKE